jgi:hypothetical protein
MTTPFSFQPSDLREIEYFADAVELLREANVLTEEDLSQLTGFTRLPGAQKHELEGVPFLILEYRFRTGAKSQETYVDMLIVTLNPPIRKLILRDASLGIRQQLKDKLLERTARNHPAPHFGVWVAHGLRNEEVEFTDPNTGEIKRPRTYYLDM